MPLLNNFKIFNPLGIIYRWVGQNCPVLLVRFYLLMIEKIVGLLYVTDCSTSLVYKRVSARFIRIKLNLLVPAPPLVVHLHGRDFRSKPQAGSGNYGTPPKATPGDPRIPSGTQDGKVRGQETCRRGLSQSLSTCQYQRADMRLSSMFDKYINNNR